MMIYELNDAKVLPKMRRPDGGVIIKGPKMQFWKGLAPCNVQRLTQSTPQIFSDNPTFNC